MAQRAINEKGISIRLACQVFGISQTCYRYQEKLSSENAKTKIGLGRIVSTFRPL
jgi:putative transposase